MFRLRHVSVFSSRKINIIFIKNNIFTSTMISTITQPSKLISFVLNKVKVAVNFIKLNEILLVQEWNVSIDKLKSMTSNVIDESRKRCDEIINQEKKDQTILDVKKQ